jgi:hypothetical protein
VVQGELILEPERPRFHHYSAREIGLFLKFVLSGSASLRGASKALQILLGEFPGELLGAPTSNCGRMWLQRLGLYELTRPKQHADDWMYVVDHTVQIGHIKCLLVIGCRLSELLDLSPGHKDFEILALEPVEKSNADIIEQQLLALVPITSPPRAILSDGCRELKKGIAQFQARHTDTRALYDIKHKAALILKKALEGDARWAQFNGEVNKARQATQPTALAFLTPPTQRTKARYMNLQPMLQWCQAMLRYLQAPFSPSPQIPLEVGPVNIHFRWLLGYQEDIAEWARMIQLLETAIDDCRQHGYHRNTAQQMQSPLKTLSAGPRSEQVADLMLKFLTEQAALAGEGEHLLATSECIESLISKAKHLEKQQASSGFTSLILGTAASVVPLTKRYIMSALEQVKTNHVLDWAKQKLGLSVQAQRHRTLGRLAAEQKQCKKSPAVQT